MKRDSVRTFPLATLTFVFLICGCSAFRNDPSLSEKVTEKSLVSPGVETISPPPLSALTVLPSVAEVLASVPEGRADPFAPVLEGTSSSSNSTQPASGDQDWEVIGVLAVGDELRAMVRTAEGTGVVCLGAAGRCPGDGQQLFPTNVAVQMINIRRGCLTLLRSGKTQRRCMA